VIFANGLHERMRIRVLLRLQEGPWFRSFAKCCIYSKYLALQILAQELGLLPASPVLARWSADRVDQTKIAAPISAAGKPIGGGEHRGRVPGTAATQDGGRGQKLIRQADRGSWQSRRNTLKAARPKSCS
jgi:hypothetical protein